MYDHRPGRVRPSPGRERPLSFDPSPSQRRYRSTGFTPDNFYSSSRRPWDRIRRTPSYLCHPLWDPIERRVYYQDDRPLEERSCSPPPGLYPSGNPVTTPQSIAGFRERMRNCTIVEYGPRTLPVQMVPSHLPGYTPPRRYYDNEDSHAGLGNSGTSIDSFDSFEQPRQYFNEGERSERGRKSERSTAIRGQGAIADLGEHPLRIEERRTGAEGNHIYERGRSNMGESRAPGARGHRTAGGQAGTCSRATAAAVEDWDDGYYCAPYYGGGYGGHDSRSAYG